MTRLQTLSALLLAFVTMTGLSACDTRAPQPTQINDCRVSDEHDSMDVREGCQDDDDFENSVELDD